MKQYEVIHKNCAEMGDVKTKDGRLEAAVGFSNDVANSTLTPHLAAVLMPFVAAKWSYVEPETGEIFLCSPETSADQQSVTAFSDKLMANFPQWELHDVHSEDAELGPTGNNFFHITPDTADNRRDLQEHHSVELSRFHDGYPASIEEFTTAAVAALHQYKVKEVR